MKKNLISSIAVLLVSLACAADAARIKSITGQPVVFKAGDVTQQKAKAGMNISANDHVKCDASSRAEVIMDGGHRVKIWPKSEFALEKASGKETSIKLIVGRVRSWVKKLRSGDKFEVRTPVAVCSVRGTDFSVAFDEKQGMKVEVYEGVVAALQEAGGREVTVNAGEFTFVQENAPPSEPKQMQEESEPFDEAVKPADADSAKEEAKAEIFQEISREDVLSRAAEEVKLAEYQNGKTAVDASGHRVRMEEYIVRGGPQNTAMPDNEFKYVVLNTRDAFPNDPANPGNGHFNFGKMVFSFNKTLPTDLTQATRTMFYKEGAAAPEWYLNGVLSVMSNTVDQVNEEATGGQMFADNPANPKAWTLGFGRYAFSVGTNGTLNTWWDYVDANSNGTIDSGELSYYNITTGAKLSFLTDSDTGKYYFLRDANQPDIVSNRTYFTEFSMPDGNTSFHFLQKNNYTGTQWIAAEDYVLDDNGNTLTLANMSNLTSKQLEEKSYGSNFERIYTCSQFQGRRIDLLFSAKLLMDAGILNLPVPSAAQ